MYRLLSERTLRTDHGRVRLVKEYRSRAGTRMPAFLLTTVNNETEIQVILAKWIQSPPPCLGGKPMNRLLLVTVQLVHMAWRMRLRFLVAGRDPSGKGIPSTRGLLEIDP
jgi:hypothetical protein